MLWGSSRIVSIMNALSDCFERRINMYLVRKSSIFSLYLHCKLTYRLKTSIDNVIKIMMFIISKHWLNLIKRNKMLFLVFETGHMLLTCVWFVIVRTYLIGVNCHQVNVKLRFEVINYCSFSWQLLKDVLEIFSTAYPYRKIFNCLMNLDVQVMCLHGFNTIIEIHKRSHNPSRNQECVMDPIKITREKCCQVTSIAGVTSCHVSSRLEWACVVKKSHTHCVHSWATSLALKVDEVLFRQLYKRRSLRQSTLNKISLQKFNHFVSNRHRSV